MWESNGSIDGTTSYDINVGSGHSDPNHLNVAGSTLYFSATDGVHGYELWQFKDANSSIVEDLYRSKGNADIFYEMAIDDSLYFTANGAIYFRGYSVDGGYELYKSLGTADTTELVINMTEDANSSIPSSFKVIYDKLYFEATGKSGTESLWISDGTKEGTELIVLGF